MKSFFALNIISFLFLCFLMGCCPNTSGYRDFYAHLHQSRLPCRPMRESDYFLIVLVNARHLDYTDTVSFFNTVAKHPSDGSRNGDFGHAWIFLKGKLNGKTVAIEGGHSGERGMVQARYFDGIMNYNDSISPYEPNPAKYLWETLNDGYFERGSGGHRPTFAAKVDLTEEEFLKILTFIHPSSYPYEQYALIGQQCSSFAVQAAALAHFFFESETSMALRPRVWYGNQWVRLWEDPCYSTIRFATPDVIEKGLMKAVREGRAENAMTWYKNYSTFVN